MQWCFCCSHWEKGNIFIHRSVQWFFCKPQNSSVRETLQNFIGHSVLFWETFHRTEHISVWLWVYIVYIALEATSDILVRLEMRQIGQITYLSWRSDEFGGHWNSAIGQHNRSAPTISTWRHWCQETDRSKQQIGKRSVVGGRTVTLTIYLPDPLKLQFKRSCWQVNRKGFL